ncbi:hypothetical protein CLF_106123 [Clonorchis sinensis]|uniref:Endonuclease/exonuclease/phosphatase domain-containing protein n=1 Tax=Clonorchis sinensis TaxID=79923 RepID=G7YPN6_CLOSI|nr:hypothetical protein CLF_106123 [Clonorchis sinensis]
MTELAPLICIMLVLTEANLRLKKAGTFNACQLDDHVLYNTFMNVKSTLGYQTICLQHLPDTSHVLTAPSERSAAPTSSGVSNSIFKSTQPVYLAAFNVRPLKQTDQQAAFALTLDSLGIDVPLCEGNYKREVDRCPFVVSAYTPTGCSPDTIKDNFYGVLSALLRRAKSSDIIVVAGDLNAQFGRLSASETQPGGRRGLDWIRTDNDEQFLQLCADRKLFSLTFEIAKVVWPHGCNDPCLTGYLLIAASAVRLTTSVREAHKREVDRCPFVVSAYTPTGCSPDTIKDNFYGVLSALLRRAKSSDIIVVAGDLNAQFGRLSASETQPGGRRGLDWIRTDNNEQFLQLCADRKLFSLTFEIAKVVWPHGVLQRHPSHKLKSITLSSVTDGEYQ